MALYLRSPRTEPRGSFNLSVLRVDGDGSPLPTGEHVYVHAAPLTMHDACAQAEEIEQRSSALQEAWDAAKRAVVDDHAMRGEINPRTGDGWTLPSSATPADLIERLNAAAKAYLAYENPISALAGKGWDLCWSPVYSMDTDTAPPCYVCGEKVIGHG